MVEEKYSVLMRLIAGSVQEMEDKKYLQDLADKYTIGQNKNYDLARSIVLNIHITEEYYINMILVAFFDVGKKNFDLSFDWREVVEEIGGIDYYKKIKVMEKLNIFSVSSIKIMIQLNNLRRAFAHGHKEDHPDYKYKGNSIFKRETIDLLIADHIGKVTKETDDFMMKPNK